MRLVRLKKTVRIGLTTFAVVLGAAGFVLSTASAAQKPGAEKRDTEPEKKILRTEDEVPLHITYYKSIAEKGSEMDSPVVVLLHMKDGNRFVWQTDGGFARQLQADGYAVVTVDLRFHGENKAGGAAGGNANQGAGKKPGKKGNDLKPEVYEAMASLDMEAVKQFIFEEHQAKNLNMNKMGIVGPEMGASVAAYYTVLDWSKEPHEDAQPGFQTPRGQDVRALVFISPQNTFHNSLPMAKVIPVLKDPEKDIAVLVCCGSDAKDKAQSEKIFEMLLQPPAQNKKRMHFKAYNARPTGTDLLDKKEVGIEEYMLVFFGEHLKKINSPWRDRRSKRERLEKKK